ncbi:MAG: SDR family oxidoreductase, partial [Pseudomonadota bacterium]
MTDFSGKKAIVLGGTSGIGLSISTMLRDSGAQVIAGGRRPAEIEGVGTVQIDVLDRDALSTLFDEHTGFDILVNAATGGPRAVGPLLEMDPDGFQGSFAKLWGYFNSVRLGAPHMSTTGSIVLVSGYPARKWSPNMSAIGTVGGSVEAFIRHAANELAPRRVNGVCPGIIDTPMMPMEGDERRQYFEGATANHLIKRAGTANECAQAAMFLLANDFVSGTIVDVDGG